MRLGLFATLIAVLCIAPGIVRADSESVALLPLDADARLEIYGQPVAAEIARALTDGKLTVIVVDAKMTLPSTPRLVIEGSITAKGAAVVLTVRIRNPVDGTVADEDKLSEQAANLAAIGKASTQLGQTLLPVIKRRLEILRKADQEKIEHPKRPPVRLPPAADPVILLGIGVPMTASLTMEPFRQALIEQVNRTMRGSKLQPSPVDASTLGKQLIMQTVSTARATRGIVFEILDYVIEPGVIPLARARVRVRIADGSQVQFDHVLSTDTIVGDKQIGPDALAARSAREIMTILRPHIRKLEPQWR